MEKHLKPYDKECMKMAMLKHEETFREQVYELHRLYKIQKMLMKNTARSRPNGHNQISDPCDIYQKPRWNLDLERPAEEYIAEVNGNGVLENEDEREIELTLGLASYYQRKKVETPPTSDSGPSFSSSSTGSGIYQRMDTRRGGSTGPKWGLVEVPNSTPSFLSGRRKSSDMEDQLRQDRLKQPPWLVQVLSLKMT
ncbi:hypothetical protein RJ639_034957 [Escallonia herrerae]|uniref:Uncharacterized protein n=1 Tax=Escallonia herrerae TaxID=1293975 RepID=A0AA89B7P2_9ASTE|nr:hypothetical protein RJ639_034957 [Escallonia herrerae]